MELPVSNSTVKKREVFGWAMYDFANSSYTTVVITFIYSAFFISQIVPADSQMRDSYWSITIIVSTLLSVILAPFLGAFADYSGNKKKQLAVLTAISVFFTGSLFFVNPGEISLGITLLVCSNTAWMLSENVIASFLPEISSSNTIGRISGIGWGIGYIGGLLSLLLMIVIISANVEQNLPLYINQHQQAMVVLAVFYFVAALPTFIFLKQQPSTYQQKQANTQLLLKASVSRVVNMMALIKEYPTLFRFFIPFTVYSAGIAVIVKFFGIYASEELAISGTFLLATGAILQVAAMIGALSFGVLQDKMGAEFTLKTSLITWILAISAIYFVEHLAGLFDLAIPHMFMVIAFIAGSALGATQSASRAVVGLITATKDVSLSFSLWGVFGKLAIVLGMMFGPIADLVGRHSALLVVIMYFFIGFLLLKLVPFNNLKNKNQ
jgi:UMF1 family MFS transporter